MLKLRRVHSIQRVFVFTPLVVAALSTFAALAESEETNDPPKVSPDFCEQLLRLARATSPQDESIARSGIVAELRRCYEGRISGHTETWQEATEHGIRAKDFLFMGKAYQIKLHNATNVSECGSLLPLKKSIVQPVPSTRPRKQACALQARRKKGPAAGWVCGGPWNRLAYGSTVPTHLESSRL